MHEHLDDLALFELVLEIDGARPEVTEAYERCEQCRKALASTRETLGLLASLQRPIAPPSRIRQAVLDGARSRYAATIVKGLARLFDLPFERARLMVHALDGDGEGWIEGPLTGLQLKHAEAGPRLAGAYTGFVRMAPGLRFPRHRHLGGETMLILEGGIRLPDRIEVHPGGVLVSDTGTAHDFEVLPDDFCIAAVVQLEGVEF